MFMTSTLHPHTPTMTHENVGAYSWEACSGCSRVNSQQLGLLKRAKHLGYVQTLCESIATKKQIGIKSVTEEKIANKLSDLAEKLYDSIERLEQRISEANSVKDIQKQSEFFHDRVLAEMDIMRSVADEIEINMPASEWPIPAYSEIIYNV